MKIAVIADIHGNWPALEKVAEALDREKVQAVLGLGDYLSVSLGSPRVAAWMKAQEHAWFVRGDNDGWDCYERFQTREREDSYAEYQFVTQLPEQVVLELEGITLLARHAYPGGPIQQRGFTEEAVREALSRRYIESVLDLKGVDIACFGDLHRPHVELCEDLVILHPGSVGAPRDQQPWAAKYVVLEVEGSAVRITQRGVPFCRETAVQEVRTAFREDPGENVWLARWLGLTPEMAEEWRPPFEGLTWAWSKPRRSVV
jgi:putative phosphoesterase